MLNYTMQVGTNRDSFLDQTGTLLILSIKSLQKIEKNPTDRNEIGKLIGFSGSLVNHAMHARNKELEATARAIPTVFTTTHDATQRIPKVSKMLQRLRDVTQSYLQAKNMLDAKSVMF